MSSAPSAQPQTISEAELAPCFHTQEHCAILRNPLLNRLNEGAVIDPASSLTMQEVTCLVVVKKGDTLGCDIQSLSQALTYSERTKRWQEEHQRAQVTDSWGNLPYLLSEYVAIQVGVTDAWLNAKIRTAETTIKLAVRRLASCSVFAPN